MSVKQNESPMDIFKREQDTQIKNMTEDTKTIDLAREFMRHIGKYRYSYHNTWMNRPIIQMQQDIVSLQEMVMKVRPDLIIETGIAHGGSIVLSASLLHLLDYEDEFYGNSKIKREVVGIDIEIRKHNRIAIEAHPMNNYITMLEGSSVDEDLLENVYRIAGEHQTVMVLLDSNHTHDHVLAELNAYAKLVSEGSYIVVYDTFIEFDSCDFPDRPWGRGNNPYTAVQEFLRDHPEFVVDSMIENKSLLTVCPGGWLKRVTK